MWGRAPVPPPEEPTAVAAEPLGREAQVLMPWSLATAERGLISHVNTQAASAGVSASHRAIRSGVGR